MIPTLPSPGTLSLAQKIAQMVVVRASGYLFDHQIQYPAWEPPAATLQHWIQTLGVGGVIFLGGSAAELALRVRQVQEWAAIPLLTTADVEEGVGQRFAGATWFPPPMAIAAIAEQNLATACQYATQMGACTAEEAVAIGLNWILAPTVDVNNNPANPVINVRAFGETTAIVSQLTMAFIQGAQAYPVLTVAKHFPGHGDTAVDSHLELPVLPHDRARLDRIELPPFQAAIKAGVDSVMSAHLHIPALDPQYPATLSDRVLTQLLRQELGFNGLIVTDALVMGAIANRYGTTEAAVLAVEAGADILLMPLDPAAAIAAVAAAVESGRIPADRIDDSINRIWQAKQKVCLPPITGDASHAWENVHPTVEPRSLMTHLANPEAFATVEQILQASLRTYHPAQSRLKHPDWQHPCRNVIVLDNAIGSDVLPRTAPAIIQPEQRGYETAQIIDRHTPPSLLNVNPKGDLTDRQPTLLQLFIRGNPFRGSAGLSQTAQDWFDWLVQSNQLQALVIYGSPYTLEQFLPHLPAEVPYVFTYGQMPVAQTIALHRLFEEPLNRAST
jgi:beta-glucosidase